MSTLGKYVAWLFFLAVLLLSLHGRPVLAAELWVSSTTGSDSGNNCQLSSAPCATIQRAIDQAGNNDSVNIVQGTYTENVIISNKAISGLTVRGGYYNCTGGSCSHTPDPNLTIIDGGGTGSPITIQTYADVVNARFEFLTIQNAGSGSGVSLTGGAGYPSHITIADSVIANNTNPGWGGGVSVAGNDMTLEVLRSSVHDNAAQYGGGFAIDCTTSATGKTDSSILIRQQTTVQNNAASWDGGGISVLNSTSNCRSHVLIEDSTIGTLNVLDPNDNPLPNTAGYDGGGVAVELSGGSGDLTVRGSVINGNIGTRYGSGIFLSASDSSSLNLEITGSFLTWNGSGTVVVGGALYAFTDTGGSLDVRLLDSTVSGNNAGSVGGMYVDSMGFASLDIERNWMFWNGGTAQSSVFDMQARNGGTLIAKLRGNNILGNGTGIVVESYDTGSIANVDIENTYLTNHVGGRGLDVTVVGGTANVSVLNSTVTANGTSSVIGGGIGVGAVSALSGGGNAQGLIRNSIVWGNGGFGDLLVGDELSGASVAHVQAGHTDLQTVSATVYNPNSGYEDLGGNISADPSFVAPGAFNFKLNVVSPAANAAVCDETDGFGNTVRVAPLIDFEGDPRPPSPTLTLLCDMGADEIDHCIDGVQNMDETGVDCGGSRCAPCGCTAGPNHVQTTLVGYPSINDAYDAISTAGSFAMSVHRMEFSPGSAFTKTAGGQAINLKISGGYECDYTTRSAPDNHTTIHGLVTIGGDTVLEADHLGIR